MRRVALVVAACTLAACKGSLRFDEGDGGGTEAGVVVGDEGRGPCVNDEGCSEGLHCDVTGACVPCFADTHCTDPARPRCAVSARRCVECAVTSDCPRGKVCDRHSRQCLETCDEGYECGAPYIGCDESRGICIACRYDRDCNASNAANELVCNRETGLCVDCLSDIACPASRPRCDPVLKQCVPCLDASDCAPGAPFCDLRTSTCVAQPASLGGASHSSMRLPSGSITQPNLP